MEIYQAVLNTRIEISPTHYDFILSLKVNLACCVRDKGDNTEAMKMYQSLLKLPSKQITMLTIKREFATCLVFSGRVHDALQSAAPKCT